MGDEPTVALLALRDFRVIGSEELDGELVNVLETAATSARCSKCGQAARAEDRRTVTRRDLPAGTRPVVLRWGKRIWSCPNRRCSVKTWTERSWFAEPRRVLTNRAREETCRRVGQEISSVAQEARRLGVTWSTAWRCVTDVGRPLFDVFEGREAKDLRRWMAMQPASWLAQMEVVSIDPHESYRSAMTRSDPFSLRPSPWRDVTLVVDPFHVVRLDEQGWERLREALRLGDPFDEVTDTWSVKEKVRDIYLTDDVDQRGRAPLQAQWRPLPVDHVEPARLGRAAPHDCRAEVRARTQRHHWLHRGRPESRGAGEKRLSHQEGHPSWWLNIEAHPDAVVRQAAQHPRHVRAHRVAGESVIDCGSAGSRWSRSSTAMPAGGRTRRP